MLLLLCFYNAFILSLVLYCIKLLKDALTLFEGMRGGGRYAATVNDVF